MARNDLTAARLRELLYYNARTGVFTWARKSATGSNICAGFDASSKDSGDGYARIGIDGYRHLAHRLAWLYATDMWPIGEVDHINGSRLDNRWVNLRDVDRAGNRQNLRGAQSNNTSGLLGVSPSKGRWAATIQHKSKKIWLGRFSTAELAHEAYLTAKRKVHLCGMI